MKILVLHNSYRKRGGEDVVVERELNLLRKSGHEVEIYIAANDSISGAAGKIKTAIGTLFSISSYRKLRRMISEFNPDVVHVHNFFPILSPSVFYACRSMRKPVVLTLHNYRIICPTSTLEHAGKLSTKSIYNGPWWALRHRVFQGSLLGTFVLCSMISMHRRIGTWARFVDRFIIPSETGREHFVAAGISGNKITTKPHFVDIPLSPERSRSGFLFVGRLSPEKGIHTLLAAAKKLVSCEATHKSEFTIVGEGPEAPSCASSGLTTVGALSPQGVEDMMRRAAALIVPSQCHETFGLVIIEAYACGLPVIASRVGAFRDIVIEGVTGIFFEPGDSDDLAEKIAWAKANPDELVRMGREARSRYENLYTPHHNESMLKEVYQQAINENAADNNES